MQAPRLLHPAQELLDHQAVRAVHKAHVSNGAVAMTGVVKADMEVIAAESADFWITAYDDIEVRSKTTHQPAAFVPFQGATGLTGDHGSLCSVVVALGVDSGVRCGIGSKLTKAPKMTTLAKAAAGAIHWPWRRTLERRY